MSRTQHIIPSGIVFAVGCWIAWVSYTQQPSEAFLFPRLISTVFVVLAVWTFVKALLGWSKIGSGITRTMAINLLPGSCGLADLYLLGRQNPGFLYGHGDRVFHLADAV